SAPEGSWRVRECALIQGLTRSIAVAAVRLAGVGSSVASVCACRRATVVNAMRKRIQATLAAPSKRGQDPAMMPSPQHRTTTVDDRLRLGQCLIQAPMSLALLLTIPQSIAEPVTSPAE